MREYILRMPDVGEGVAEAELVEWHVKPGDPVREDMILAAVMTDKATVEIPSPVSGTVLWLGAELGDTIAVNAPLVRIEVAAEDPQSVSPQEMDSPEPVADTAEAAAPEAFVEESRKPLASPAVRRRAEESGIDLHQVRGTGASGNITHEDLDSFLSSASGSKAGIEEIRITGLRRKIAGKMALSVSRIPHITYVEEVDVTDLEELRAAMNTEREPEQPKLTVLPFLMRAVVKAVAEQPAVNATFDDEAGIISRYSAVHIGIATQTPGGLMVPVVRNAGARSIWDCAAELARVSEAARTGSAGREDLSGSTITISSLGALGGIVTTPVINHPEVAIIGVNRIAIRPMWDGGSFVPRKMMNLSSSFDHRIIDGWDAATFIQRIKAILEKPGLV